MTATEPDKHSLLFALHPPVAGLARLSFAELLANGQALHDAGRGAEALELMRRCCGPTMPGLVGDEARFREIVLQALRLDDARSFERALQCRLAITRPIALRHDAADPPGPTVVRWAVEPDRASAFTLHASLRGLHRRDPGLHFTLMDRLVSLLPLLGAYLRDGWAPGVLHLNLGDEQHHPGVSFCNDAPGSLLIPDSHFLSTQGYAGIRAHYAAHPVPWADRIPQALWRGSSTGYRASPDVMALDRVRLCLLARRPEAAGLLDAGLTSLVQLAPAPEAARAEAAQLEAADLVRPFVAPERFPEWRYQVDVDGNTSSWPGLMQKLLTGSPVLKVASARGWRQWYYPRLRPWENVVPVANDLSDLLPALARLRHDDALAQRIGAAGAALAGSLTFEAELRGALPVLQAAMRAG